MHDHDIELIVQVLEKLVELCKPKLFDSIFITIIVAITILGVYNFYDTPFYKKILFVLGCFIFLIFIWNTYITSRNAYKNLKEVEVNKIKQILYEEFDNQFPKSQ